MTALAIIIVLTLCLILLVRRGLVQADLSMPWFLALIVFGFLSTNDTFVNWVGALLGILYPPIAIVFITIAILLGLITVLLIAFSRIRHRQLRIVRRIAELELAIQEQALSPLPPGASCLDRES
jgi:hypothetical protein